MLLYLLYHKYVHLFIPTVYIFKLFLCLWEADIKHRGRPGQWQQWQQQQNKHVMYSHADGLQNSLGSWPQASSLCPELWSQTRAPPKLQERRLPACMQNHPALNKHPRPPQGSGVTGQRYPLRILSPWGCSPLPGRLKGLIHLLTHSTKAHRAGYLGYAHEQSQDTCLHRALVQYQREKFFKCI